MVRTAAIPRRVLLGISALLALALASAWAMKAGGDGGADGVANPSRLVSTYAHGGPREVASARAAWDGSLIRDGQCEQYYPSGQLRWRGVFTNGTLDVSKPQTWWNEDGSINRTSEDGPALP